MTARTDQIRTVREARDAVVTAIDPALEAGGATRRLLTTGRLADFRAAYALMEPLGDGEVAIDPLGAALLKVDVGDTVMHVGRT
jgi:arginine N-succinyltransferase